MLDGVHCDQPVSWWWSVLLGNGAIYGDQVWPQLRTDQSHLARSFGKVHLVESIHSLHSHFVHEPREKALG